jgi:hypothetical protein
MTFSVNRDIVAKGRGDFLQRGGVYLPGKSINDSIYKCTQITIVFRRIAPCLGKLSDGCRNAMTLTN